MTTSLNTRLIARFALHVIAVVTFSGGVLFAWMFYVFYLKWVGSFENGRYFDPDSLIVYHESSSVSGVLAAILFTACAAAVLLTRTIAIPRRIK